MSHGQNSLQGNYVAFMSDPSETAARFNDGLHGLPVSPVSVLCTEWGVGRPRCKHVQGYEQRTFSMCNVLA